MNLSSIRRRHVVDGARWRPETRLAHGRGGRSRLTPSSARCTRLSAGSPRATAAQGRGPVGAAVGRRLGTLRGARRQDRRARWLCRRLRPSRRARRERQASRPEATRSTFRGHRGDRRGGPTAAAPGVARRSAGDRLRRVRDGRRRHQPVAPHAGGRPWPPGWSAHDGGVMSGVGPSRERADERKRRCATRAPGTEPRSRRGGGHHESPLSEGRAAGYRRPGSGHPWPRAAATETAFHVEPTGTPLRAPPPPSCLTTSPWPRAGTNPWCQRR